MISVSLLKVTPASTSLAGEESSSLQVSFPDEARAFVEAISPDKPINLITIWGPARTGKSFFMNALAGENAVEVFPVSGGVDPCTVGVSMSTTARSLAGFSQQQYNSGERMEDCSATGAPMVGFMDVEGQGDKHLSYDMLLATPLLLISKMRQKTEGTARREVQDLKEQVASSTRGPKLADYLNGLQAVAMDIITFGSWRHW